MGKILRPVRQFVRVVAVGPLVPAVNLPEQGTGHGDRGGSFKEAASLVGEGSQRRGKPGGHWRWAAWLGPPSKWPTSEPLRSSTVLSFNKDKLESFDGDAGAPHP